MSAREEVLHLINRYTFTIDTKTWKALPAGLSTGNGP